MTTIEVLNITYENNRIQECKIIIDEKEFNATWEDPEYNVTDKKDSKVHDSDEDEEPITEEQYESLGPKGTKKAKGIAKFLKNKRK
jgi:hypothetical protein